MVKWDDYFNTIEIPKDKDKLELIFEMQKKLMERYGVEKKDINTLDGQNQLRAFGMRIFEEIGEIFHCLKNKSWVVNQTEVDKNAVYDEIADVWHFFIELLILFDLDAEKCTKLYLAKNKVNNHRLDSNY